MKTALFVNFSNEEYVGYWGGKAKKFAPGAQVPLPEYLAAHFAKHLTNRELLKLGHERDTSPKRPKDVPRFWDMFNKACIVDVDEIDTTDKRDELEVQMETIAKSRIQQKEDPEHKNQGKFDNQLKTPVDSDDDEEGFPDKPKE
jgi:hypothetical protein